MERTVKTIPKADFKSSRLGWYYDPYTIHNIQRESCDIEEVSLEVIDAILHALERMGFIISE